MKIAYLFLALLIASIPARAAGEKEAALAAQADAEFDKMARTVFADEYFHLEIFKKRAGNPVAQLKAVEAKQAALYAEQRGLNVNIDPRGGVWSRYPDMAGSAYDSPVRKNIARYEELGHQISSLDSEAHTLKLAIVDEAKRSGSSYEKQELAEAEKQLEKKRAALKEHGPAYLEKNFWASEGPRTDGLDHATNFRMSKSGQEAYEGYSKWAQKAGKSALGKKVLGRYGIAAAILGLSISAAQAHEGTQATELKATDFSNQEAPAKDERTGAEIGTLGE